MLVTPDWTIVFNPRTGSRSLAAGLNELGYRVTHGHPKPEKVTGERVIGVVRNPVTWVWSFYYTSQKWPMRFEDWLDEHHAEVGIAWADGLNAYRDVITEYWLYERGIEGLLWKLGHRGVTLPLRGYKWKPIAPYWCPQIDRYFPLDCELYDQLLHDQEYR